MSLRIRTQRFLYCTWTGLDMAHALLLERTLLAFASFVDCIYKEEMEWVDMQFWLSEVWRHIPVNMAETGPKSSSKHRSDWAFGSIIPMQTLSESIALKAWSICYKKASKIHRLYLWKADWLSISLEGPAMIPSRKVPDQYCDYWIKASQCELSTRKA